jgi:hypothetical protein
VWNWAVVRAEGGWGCALGVVLQLLAQARDLGLLGAVRALEVGQRLVVVVVALLRLRLGPARASRQPLRKMPSLRPCQQSPLTNQSTNMQP